MTKLTTLLLLSVLIFSCKNTSEKDTPMAEKLSETITIAETPPTYKLSLAQWSLNKLIFTGKEDPMDFASTAKEMGFEGLEYVSQLYTNENVKFSMKDAGLQNILNELKKRSDSLGLENLLIMIDGEGDLSFTDEKATQTAIDNHKKWIDAAQFLGCHSIRINLFGEEDPEAWVTNSVKSLKSLAIYAAPKNVNIIVENHGGLSSDGGLLARVMKETAMSNVGTLPDFGNFCLKKEGGARWNAPCVEEYDKYKGVAELMPFAKGVSAKSYAFDDEGNETTVDYFKMMQIVKDSGFEGYIGTEFEGDAEDPTEGIAATRALILKAASQAK
jgi:sugar phosphate isomerase/epimerase